MESMSVKILPDGKYVGVSKEVARGRTYWRATIYRKGKKTLRKLFVDKREAARWYNQQVIRHGLNKPLNFIDGEILR